MRFRPSRLGTQSSDAEVAGRCELLVKKIPAQREQAIVGGRIDLPGAAGKRFQQIAGTAKEARHLFADMVDDDRRAILAEEAALDPARASRLYRSEFARVQHKHQSATSAEVVLIAFLGACGDAGKLNDVDEVYSVMNTGIIDLATGPQSEPFVKLFNACWRWQK